MLTFDIVIIATTASGEVIQVLGFIQRYPAVLLKMVSFGLASAVGQVSLCVCLCVSVCIVDKGGSLPRPIQGGGLRVILAFFLAVHPKHTVIPYKGFLSLIMQKCMVNLQTL